MRDPSALDNAEEFRLVSTDRAMRGWVCRDLPEELFADFVRDPDRFLDVPSRNILRDGSKAKVVKQVLKDRGGGTREVIIKRFQYGSFLRRLVFLFFPSPARRSLAGALVLKGAGIGTPSPLAALEWRSWRRLGTSYYISEDVRGCQSLRNLWWGAGPPSEERAGGRRRILSGLASLFYRLHSSGIYHRDLKGSNILVRGDGRGDAELLLIDLDGVRKGRRLSQRKRIKNLFQLYQTLARHRLSVREMLFFLKGYADLFSMPRKERKGLARAILESSRRWERRFESTHGRLIEEFEQRRRESPTLVEALARRPILIMQLKGRSRFNRWSRRMARRRGPADRPRLYVTMAKPWLFGSRIEKVEMKDRL